MRKRIDCQVGIYSTEYRMIEHKNGSVTVIAPWIKWTNNTGILAFNRQLVTRPPLVAAIKRFFQEGHLVDETGETMDNLIY